MIENFEQEKIENRMNVGKIFWVGIFLVLGTFGFYIVSSKTTSKLIINKCITEYGEAKFLAIYGYVDDVDRSYRLRNKFLLYYERPDFFCYEWTNGNHFNKLLFTSKVFCKHTTSCIKKCKDDGKTETTTTVAEALRESNFEATEQVLPLISMAISNKKMLFYEDKISYVGKEKANNVLCFKLVTHDTYNWKKIIWIGCEDSLIHKVRELSFSEGSYFDGHIFPKLAMTESLLIGHLPLNLGRNAVSALTYKKYSDTYYFYLKNLPKLSSSDLFTNRNEKTSCLITLTKENRNLDEKLWISNDPRLQKFLDDHNKK